MKPAPEVNSSAGFVFLGIVSKSGNSFDLYDRLYCTFGYRNKINKSGLYPIHLRVTINREQRYYQLKVPQKVSRSQWTGKADNWSKNTHPFAFEINNKIIEKKSIVIELIKRCYNLNNPVTFYAVDRELSRKVDWTNFNDYVRNYIDNPPENGKAG